MQTDFDVAVIGSGFAGSLFAMIMRRLGHSVALIERGQHPRFVIGESSTPLANLLLEELARRYDLPRLLPLSKWGAWQHAYPQVGCGLKRGFTFYHHCWDRPFQDDSRHQNQLLVAASPHDRIADTHWYRPDFDHFLMSEAQAIGVEYLDQTTLDGIVPEDDGVALNGRRHGQELKLRAGFVVDATGPRGCLHRALKLPETRFESLPHTQGLYTHFTNVRRWDSMFPEDERPPYPVDDAALHHVFEGGWIWVLRFNNGVTSAGVAATDALADELRLAEGAPAWQRLLQRLPSVREQFADAEPTLSFIHASQLSFLSGEVVGRHWALLPSAAGFVDPLLSTGFPLTLLGISRLAQIMERGRPSSGFAERLTDYARQTAAELLAAEQLVAALYANFNDFELFKRLALLYFAAASFCEAARRLGKPELASAFLLHDHPHFGPGARMCAERACGRRTPEQRMELLRQIDETLQPVDVTGLSDRARRDWYPVAARDLFTAAPKLGVGEKEIRELLARCGFDGNGDGG